MASNPGYIPAGGKEAIRVEVKTAQRGGSTLRKGFLVYTNDPDKPKVRLSVSGKVNGYITFTPSYVRFVGQVGQQLTKAIEIRSIEGHPFAIQSVKLHKGENLQVETEPLKRGGQENGYLLTVVNTKKTAGFYQDLIIVETDSAKKPTIRIPVSARIRKSPQANAASAHD